MPTDDGKDDSIDVEVVRQLAELLSETGLTEIEVERGALRIKLSRGLSMADIESMPTLQAAPAPTMIAAPAAAAAPASATPEPARGETVKSPMVGTVYMQSGPGSPPFVSVGARVAAGQTIMIVEAMKTMNQIPAPRAGVVLEILVQDAQPVEYGEPLIILE